MADVFDNISFIRTAHYGREVRTAIADSIEQCYAHATGDPNSLSSIIRALSNYGNGNVVRGTNNDTTTSISTTSATPINVLYLKPGVWIVKYEASITAMNLEPVEEIVYGLGVADSSRTMLHQSVFSAPSNVNTSHNNVLILTVDSENLIQDDDPTINGTKSYLLMVQASGETSPSAKSYFDATLLKGDISDEETSLTEQVAENAAAIATLQSLGTDISSLQSQHANDIDELTDLIEDSVVSLRASLDEKILSLDENDYLTLD